MSLNLKMTMMEFGQANCEKFMERIDFNGPVGCWIWTTSLNYKGYGRFYFLKKSMYAHRLAYLLFVGPIPTDHGVFHKCDVRACVNPYHLFTGTEADNNLDCSRKGRRRQMFTPEQVIAIRNTPGIQPVARSYGVNPGTIWQIKNRHSYSWIP